MATDGNGAARTAAVVGRRPEEAIHDVGATLAALTEFAHDLPRQLRELSAGLLACQSAGVVTAGRGPDAPGVDSSIVAARFALSEATTAALALDRRIADARRLIAALVAGTPGWPVPDRGAP